jgi:hypothetical protein
VATVAEIESKTLDELRQVQMLMESPRWVFSLEDEPAKIQLKAAREKLRVQHAIVSLENAILGELRDKLAANEADLEAGRTRLETARQRLEGVAQVVNAVDGFLDVVARVVPLLLSA